jgi:membrane protein DedA with SNARE-associated domain
VLAFAAALAETVIGLGLIIPGSLIVLLCGVAAAGGDHSLRIMIPIVACGAMIGDNVNYYLGKRYGKTWVSQDRAMRSARYFAQGGHFFRRMVEKSIFLGRLIPMIKEIVLLVAGMVRMDTTHFMLYNALGALGWSLW